MLICPFCKLTFKNEVRDLVFRDRLMCPVCLRWMNEDKKVGLQKDK